MKKLLFVVATSLLASGCTAKDVTNPCDANCQLDAESMKASSVNTDQTVVSTTPAEAKDVTIACSAKGANTYVVGGVSLVALSDWEEVAPQNSEVTLQLANQRQNLTFTVVNVKIKTSFKEYLSQGISDFKSRGLDTVVSSNSLNGSNYTSLNATGSGNSALQLVYNEGASVKVLSCNGDMFDQTDSDACQAVFSTVKIQ